MDKKCPFLNPVPKCPWVNDAPKTYRSRKRNKFVSVENDVVRSTPMTMPMWLHETMYKNMGFYAHSGPFHSFYLTAKRALLEEDLKKYQIPSFLPSLIPIVPKPIKSPDVILPDEIIDITADSPPGSPKRTEDATSSSAKNQKQIVPKKLKYLKVRSKTVTLPPKAASTSIRDEGCKPETTRRSVGVVLTRRGDDYMAALL